MAGFLHCLDCADLVLGYASVLQQEREHGVQAAAKASEALILRREDLFAVCKKLGAYNRLSELKAEKDGDGSLNFRIDPYTRYRHPGDSGRYPDSSSGRSGRLESTT